MLKAREALEDCKEALRLFIQHSQEERLWRIYWFSCLGLLKCVNDVLHNIDCELNKCVKDISHKLWLDINKQKDKNKIYFYFVQEERNFAIHQYVTKQKRDELVPTIDRDATNLSSYILWYPPWEEGIFSGRTYSELVEEAIEWWERILSYIERASGLDVERDPGDRTIK